MYPEWMPAASAKGRDGQVHQQGCAARLKQRQAKLLDRAGQTLARRHGDGTVARAAQIQHIAQLAFDCLFARSPDRPLGSRIQKFDVAIQRDREQGSCIRSMCWK
jgi:hypothetical protein